MRKVSIIALAVVFTLFTLAFASDDATHDVTLSTSTEAAISIGGTAPDISTPTLTTAGSDYATADSTSSTLSWSANGNGGTIDAYIDAWSTSGSLKVEVGAGTKNSDTRSSDTSAANEITLATSGNTKTVVSSVTNEAINGATLTYTWDPDIDDTVSEMNDTVTVTYTLSGLSS